MNKDMVKVPRELLEKMEQNIADSAEVIATSGFRINGAAATEYTLRKWSADLRAILAQPVADEQAEQQPEQSGLVEALESAVHLMDLMQDDIDSLIGYAGGTGGFGEYRDRINGISDALSAQGDE